MKVNSRLAILIAERRQPGERAPGIRTIAAESGASVSTVQRLMNNSMRRVPLDDLAALCKYLGVSVGDILQYTPDENS